jgi:hypothetical protein
MGGKEVLSFWKDVEMGGQNSSPGFAASHCKIGTSLGWRNEGRIRPGVVDGRVVPSEV